MSHICQHCGKYSEPYSGCEKNVAFAYAYGARPKRIEDMLRKEKNMDKLTITLTAPEGYEFTGEIRQATKGEHYYDLFGSDRGTVAECGSFTDYKYPILRPKWQWPEWLNVTYIARDADGVWHGFHGKPCIGTNRWIYTSVHHRIEIPTSAFNITFPNIPNWENSLIKNPNIEG